MLRGQLWPDWPIAETASGDEDHVFTATNIRAAVEQSLRRMHTDYLDLVQVHMSPSQAQTALGTVAAIKGTVINHERPILETELPLDGSRFEGLVSPVTRSPVLARNWRSSTTTCRIPIWPGWRRMTS